MTRQNILKRTSNLWKPSSISQKNNGQQYNKWRLCLLVLWNTSCLRLKCPASCLHGTSTCARKFMSYYTNNFSKSWSTVSDLNHQPLTRTSIFIGVLAVSTNVLRIQINPECVSWIMWRHVYSVRIILLFWLYYWKFDLQHFPRQLLTLKFMTTLLNTLLNGFWRFVRRLFRRNHPLHVPHKNQQPIIPIKNTIRIILHKNLTQMMIL